MACAVASPKEQASDPQNKQTDAPFRRSGILRCFARHNRTVQVSGISASVCLSGSSVLQRSVILFCVGLGNTRVASATAACPAGAKRGFAAAGRCDSSTPGNSRTRGSRTRADAFSERGCANKRNLNNGYGRVNLRVCVASFASQNSGTKKTGKSGSIQV